MGELHRVAVILRAKKAGFGLGSIREMLTSGDSTARREVLRRHHGDLVRRIAEARAALDLIECALDCDHEDFTRCVHYQATVAAQIGSLCHGGRPGPAGRASRPRAESENSSGMS